MESPAEPNQNSAPGTPGQQRSTPEPSPSVGTPPRPGDPYDATPRIDDKPVREMARTNSEMLARSQESMNEMRSRIEAEAQQARAHAAEALAATISAAGIGAAGIGAATSEIDGPKIRETASSLPPLSGSGAARDLPWETPPTLGAYGAGLLAASDGVVEGFVGELARHGQVQVFRNVRLSDFGDKAPLVVTKGTRAVIVDVIDLPADALSWVSERGKSVLKGGTSRSDKPARITETVAAWSRDNPDADFASVLTLTAGSPSTVTGESAETVNLLESQDVVGTVVDWLADAGTDAAVTEKLYGYLESRANRF